MQNPGPRLGSGVVAWGFSWASGPTNQVQAISHTFSFICARVPTTFAEKRQRRQQEYPEATWNPKIGPHLAFPVPQDHRIRWIPGSSLPQTPAMLSIFWKGRCTARMPHPFPHLSAHTCSHHWKSRLKNLIRLHLATSTIYWCAQQIWFTISMLKTSIWCFEVWWG